MNIRDLASFQMIAKEQSITNRQVENLFREREGNVAFSIAGFEEELYDVTELETFPVKLLVHESHPLSNREAVTIEDLRCEPLYIESSQFKIHDMIIDKCRDAGFEPNIVFETSGFSLCHKMVRANKGISVTVDFVFDDMKEKGMRLIPFADGSYELPSIRRELPVAGPVGGRCA